MSKKDAVRQGGLKTVVENEYETKRNKDLFPLCSPAPSFLKMPWVGL